MKCHIIRPAPNTSICQKKQSRIERLRPQDFFDEICLRELVMKLGIDNINTY